MMKLKARKLKARKLKARKLKARKLKARKLKARKLKARKPQAFLLGCIVVALSIAPTMIPALAEAVGDIFTVAGGGSDDHRPPGAETGPAASAKLTSPVDTAIDGLGNVYIAEAGWPRIRKVDPAGTITTISGGTQCSGLPDQGRPMPTCGEFGLAKDAAFSILGGIAVDRWNNLYVVDRHRVRYINLGSTPTKPCGLTTEVPPAHITTCAGNGDNQDYGYFPPGPATSAALRNPTSVAVDDDGNVFIADTLNFSIKRVDAVTGIITRAVGQGRGQTGDGEHVSHFTAKIGAPTDIDFDADGNLYIATPEFFKVRKVSPTGTLSTFAGHFNNRAYSGDGGPATGATPATSAGMASPYSVEVDASGGVLIADSNDHRIRRVDTATGVISTIAGNGVPGFAPDGVQATSQSTLNTPVGLDVDPTGTRLFIANLGDSTDPSNIVYGRILRLNLQGPPPPVVNNLSPPLGPVTGGTAFEIEGDLLDNATVTFGGAPAAVSSNSKTRITGTVPAHLPPGPVPVVVTKVAGGAATNVPTFTYHPALTSLSPPSGRPEGGETLTINGQGFTNINQVRITTVPETVIPISGPLTNDTQVTITTPASPPGQVRIYVTAYGLESIAVPAEANIFTYKDPRPEAPPVNPNQPGTTNSAATTSTSPSGPSPASGGFGLAPAQGAAPASLSSPSSAFISSSVPASGSAQAFDPTAASSSGASVASSTQAAPGASGSQVQAAQARVQLGVRPVVAEMPDPDPQAAPRHPMTGRAPAIPTPGFAATAAVMMLIGCFAFGTPLARRNDSRKYQPQRA